MLAILLVWQISLNDWKSVRRLAALSLIGFIVSLPYVLEMIQFRALPMYQNFFLKNSLPARSFVLISARYIILIGVVFVDERKAGNTIDSADGRDYGNDSFAGSVEFISWQRSGRETLD